MKHNVQFDPVEHVYTFRGERWPSVTQVIEPMLELDGIPKQVLQAAAQFGSHVHQACHLFNIGLLDEHDLDEHLRPYLEAWKRFLYDTGAKVIESERLVYDYALKVAGTLDCVIHMPGKETRTVTDIKTGSSIPWTVGIQTAAYSSMLKQDYLDYTISKERLCCQLLPDSTYRIQTLKNTSDWNDFVSATNVYNMRKRHGRV